MDNRDSIGVYGRSMGLYIFYRDIKQVVKGMLREVKENRYARGRTLCDKEAQR
jgi:hypothetical protein